jgi:hypothetical protein
MRTTQRIGSAALVAGVAAALVFGGRTAAASAGAPAECSSPGQACVVTVQCIQTCFPYGGRCSTLVGAGCCVCNR